ncbi:MAG: LacI family transcriptional regulator [Clostridiales Family XIII bacterium]|jgi:LacI family transcriptional regulator|nr:LacI family transcriptional regulator [Clostridiales Family XIII bacterium]
MVTLKDVALLAGVSASTVSYVLNGKKRVRKETYDRIVKAAKELNYSPNRAAISLKTDQSNTIGVMVNNMQDLFFMEIIRAIENTAYEYKYNVIFCDAVNSEEREISNIRNLLSQRIDGLIFAGTGKTTSVHLKNIGIPVVTLDRSAGSGDVSINTDNVSGGELAAGFLVDRGKTPIAVITYSTLVGTFFDRVSGYRKALAARNLPCDDQLVVEAEFSTHDEGYRAAMKLLDKGVGFKSIFCVNDMLAVGAMRALVERGYRIPEDIAIVGYDDIPIAKLFVPSLTTIRQPQYDMGQKAVEYLCKMIRKEVLSEEEKTLIIEPELIIRETV